MVNSSLSNLLWALVIVSTHGCYSRGDAFLCLAASGLFMDVKYLMWRDFFLHAFLCVQVRKILSLLHCFSVP